jgi:hypothetical protein
VRRRLLAVVACLVLAGCAEPVATGFSASQPTCRYQGRDGTPLVVLMAQAVPTASLLPCIALLPTGWFPERDLDIRNGRASFALGSDRAGREAVTVVLAATCDVGGATEVPSDELGTRRYELVGGVRKGYQGTRYYRFEGGCVTYEFRFTGEGRAVPVSEATLGLGFVSRTNLDIQVREQTGGLRLNPPPAEP